jgi:GTP-binding protein
MLQKAGSPSSCASTNATPWGLLPRTFTSFTIWDWEIPFPFPRSTVTAPATSGRRIRTSGLHEGEEEQSEFIRVAVIGKTMWANPAGQPNCRRRRVIVSTSPHHRDATDTVIENEKGKYILSTPPVSAPASPGHRIHRAYSVLRAYMAVDRVRSASS